MQITSPGGNLEKIKYAVLYGADAVYCAYEKFGLRAFAGNLNKDDLLTAIQFCHDHRAKLFLTLNIYSRNEDWFELTEFIEWLSDTEIDGVIVSDPGIFHLIRSRTQIPLHISTQSNTTNLHSARFWYEQGAKRVIPARELSLQELIEINESIPELEVEAFIHGAMCIAWSGRCLLSAALNNRSANYGECTQPCRWNWALVEESRPGQNFPIQEDQYGTYVLSSKDLCLLNEVPSLLAGGICAGKIEGRMKSLYYVAQLTRIYRQAVKTDPADESMWQRLWFEANKVSHRPYYTGFINGFDQAAIDKSIVVSSGEASTYEREWQFCGTLDDADNDGLAWFDCFSKISRGEDIEIIFPDLTLDITITVDKIYNQDGELVTDTKPNQKFAMPVTSAIPKHGIIRKCIK
jgi:putative protease